MIDAAPSEEAIVRLAHVGKTYRSGTVALKDVSLAIAPGEFVGLLGPSGCGKSTLLRLIAGLSRVTSGDIVWRRDIDPGHSKGGVGFVFQEPTLMPWANVLDNVRLPLRLQRIERNASVAAAREAIELVGLAGFERSIPRELSGGMRMRVSIARALATKPRLLLMDEPFAALDEMTRFRLNDDLLRLWHEFGWTVVFVSHSVFESAYLAQRVVLMSPRPGQIRDVISVGNPSARDGGYRTSPSFNAVCRDISDRLRLASGEEAR